MAPQFRFDRAGQPTGAVEGVRSDTHQIRRPPNCIDRAALPELRVLSIAFVALVNPAGLFGLFRTLKKSTFRRNTIRSVIFVFLNAEASKNH